MAQISRTTLSGLDGKYISKTPGSRVGLQFNTFGLQGLRRITGTELAQILLNRMEPIKNEAKAEWPRETGASGDTIGVSITEVEPKSARVALMIGGEQLINDPRNKSKKDYTPYVEFNGTAKTAPGTLTRVMVTNQKTFAMGVRDDLQALMKSKTNGRR